MFNSDPGLRLRPLRADDEAAFRRAHGILAAEGFHFGLGLDPGLDWDTYLKHLDNERQGVNVPRDWVPATFLVADVAGKIVGRASIRHELNDSLRLQGGHIGYAVLPEFRRRGYATEILRQSLIIARSIGIGPVLVTVNDNNTGSIAAIEKNGGVLDSVIRPVPLAPPLRRYWIS